MKGIYCSCMGFDIQNAIYFCIFKMDREEKQEKIPYVEEEIKNDYFICCQEVQNPTSFVMLSQFQKVRNQLCESKYPLIVCLHDVESTSGKPTWEELELHSIRDQLKVPFLCFTDVIEASYKIAKEDLRDVIFLFPVEWENEAEILRKNHRNLIGTICYNSESNENMSSHSQRFTYYTKSRQVIYNTIKARIDREPQKRILMNFMSMKHETCKSMDMIKISILMENLKIQPQVQFKIWELLEKLLKQLEQIDHELVLNKKFFQQVWASKLTNQQAIIWYTKETFIYKLVNRLLRATFNPCSLFYLQPYYQILSKGIKQLFKQQRKKNSTQQFFCYRGGIISINQIEQLQCNEGSIVQNMGFLSTSQNQMYARSFIVNVFFIIYVDASIIGDGKFEQGYVSLYETKLSQYPGQKQVLFHPLNSFKIVSVIKKNSGGQNDFYYEVNMEYGEIDRILNKNQEHLNEDEILYRNIANQQLKVKSEFMKNDKKWQGHLFVEYFQLQSIIYWTHFLDLKNLNPEYQLEAIYMKFESQILGNYLNSSQKMWALIFKAEGLLQKYDKNSIRYAVYEGMKAQLFRFEKNETQEWKLMNSSNQKLLKIEGQNGENYLLNCIQLGLSKLISVLINSQ